MGNIQTWTGSTWSNLVYTSDKEEICTISHCNPATMSLINRYQWKP